MESGAEVAIELMEGTSRDLLSPSFVNPLRQKRFGGLESTSEGGPALSSKGGEGEVVDWAEAEGLPGWRGPF
jgi:hypothetical protein